MSSLRLFLAGAVFAALSPPMLTSETAVLIPNTLHPATQVAIASSSPVLASALRSIDPATSLGSLRGRVQVRGVTSRVILIGAKGQTAATAEHTANAVADSYIAHANGPRRMRPQVLDPAAIARGTPLPARLLVTAGLGTLLGALIGVFGTLVFGRRDRRLRERG